MKEDRILTMRNRHLIEDYDRPKTVKRDAIWPPDHPFHQWISSLSPQNQETYYAEPHPLMLKAAQDVKRVATHASASPTEELANTKSFRDASHAKTIPDQLKDDGITLLVLILNMHGVGRNNSAPIQVASANMMPTSTSSSTALFPLEIQSVLNSLPPDYKAQAIDLLKRANSRRINRIDFFKHPNTLLIHKDILLEIPLDIFKETNLYTEDFLYTVATVYGESSGVDIGYAPVASVIFRRAYLGWRGVNPGITIDEINSTNTSEIPVKGIDAKTKRQVKTKVKQVKKHKPHSLLVYCSSPKEVCLFTGFDACFGPLGHGKYGCSSNFKLAQAAINFLISNDFDKNKYINTKYYMNKNNKKIVDEIIDVITKIYPLYFDYTKNDLSSDAAKNAILYYSPAAMSSPGQVPSWVSAKINQETLVEEVFPEGFPNKNKAGYTDFKFYKYKKKYAFMKG